MTHTTLTPIELGWSAFFGAQLEIDDLSATLPVRVMAVHRNGLILEGAGDARQIPPFSDDPSDPEGTATVGDWLLLDRATLRPVRRLDRKSLFKRRAPGTGRRTQLIAANVDTLFIVSSCNQDFNPARLERYLALAREADVVPVVILTKADLSDDPEDYVRRACRLLPGLVVEAVDAHDSDSVARLQPWCGPGQTVALVGSSGVGKSTLVNTMTGTGQIATQGIRKDDAKGRHTTTARMLHRLPAGGWLLDTPGMRELQLTDVRTGLDEVFADVVDFARACRFSDCRHDGEPGCAVRAAIEAGELDADRLDRWRKLVREDVRNSETLAERRARDKSFGKMVKGAVKVKRLKDGA